MAWLIDWLIDLFIRFQTCARKKVTLKNMFWKWFVFRKETTRLDDFLLKGWGLSSANVYTYSRSRQAFSKELKTVVTCKSRLRYNRASSFSSSVDPTWAICTRRAGELYKARSRLYWSEILQINILCFENKIEKKRHGKRLKMKIWTSERSI